MRREPTVRIPLGVLGLLFALGTRQRIDLSVAKDRNPPFMLLSNGEVRNDYTIKLRNMETRVRPMAVMLEGLPGAVMWTDEMGRESASRELQFTVAADQTKPVRIYVVAPEGVAEQDFHFVLSARDREAGGDRAETRFDAPEESQ